LCYGRQATVFSVEADSNGVPGQKAAEAAGLEHKYKGVESCAFCHIPAPLRPQVDGMKYYTFDEYVTWIQKDKHSMAYEVLGKSNSTSAQIARLLGIDPQTDARCLSCHSLVCDAKNYAPETAVKLQQGGVSCEACHGKSSEWSDKHKDPDQWRKKKDFSRQDRIRAGMTDLRDPVQRADTCLSCHLGSMRDGKVVTHEMYAAGHPPVSGFEIETFLGSMPKHWDEAKKLPPEYEEQYGGKPEKEYASRMVALGGLVALRNYARLLCDEAQQRKAAIAAGSAELALYDCQACHHELAVPSWRQQRGYRGQPPGRPRVRTWPLALARLRAAGAGEAVLTKDLDQLDSALGSRPFGDPDKVAAAAAALADKTQAAIDVLASKPFDAKTAAAMFARLCQVGMEEVPDYESARQIGWALRVVYRDLAPPPGKEAEAQKELKALAAELALDLPQGKELAFNTSIALAIDAASRYKPEQFQQHLKQLAKLAGD
jgi:Zn finger protein HypA/HybF involved in hydrogenase expression